MDEVEKYILQFPEPVQDILWEIRRLILENAPDAEERMAYGMPGYRLEKKPLVYFAAFARHVGFYATPTGHEAFKDELSAYKQGKGSVQFPLDKPMPYELMARIVRYRVAENQARR